MVGGAKVSTKLDLLGNLVGKVDKPGHRRRHGQHLPVRAGDRGGQVAMRERDLADTALEILEKAKAANCKVLLPVDVVVADEFKADAPNMSWSMRMPAPTTR
jgi:phosphoglycerate kinase